MTYAWNAEKMDAKIATNAKHVHNAKKNVQLIFHLTNNVINVQQIIVKTAKSVNYVDNVGTNAKKKATVTNVNKY